MSCQAATPTEAYHRGLRSGEAKEVGRHSNTLAQVSALLAEIYGKAVVGAHVQREREEIARWHVAGNSATSKQLQADKQEPPPFCHPFSSEMMVR